MFDQSWRVRPPYSSTIAQRRGEGSAIGGLLAGGALPTNAHCPSSSFLNAGPTLRRSSWGCATTPSSRAACPSPPSQARARAAPAASPPHAHKRRPAAAPPAPPPETSKRAAPHPCPRQRRRQRLLSAPLPTPPARPPAANTRRPAAAGAAGAAPRRRAARAGGRSGVDRDGRRRQRPPFDLRHREGGAGAGGPGLPHSDRLAIPP